MSRGLAPAPWRASARCSARGRRRDRAASPARRATACSSRSTASSRGLRSLGPLEPKPRRLLVLRRSPAHVLQHHELLLRPGHAARSISRSRSMSRSSSEVPGVGGRVGEHVLATAGGGTSRRAGSACRGVTPQVLLEQRGEADAGLVEQLRRHPGVEELRGPEAELAGRGGAGRSRRRGRRSRRSGSASIAPKRARSVTASGSTTSGPLARGELQQVDPVAVAMEARRLGVHGQLPGRGEAPAGGRRTPPAAPRRARCRRWCRSPVGSLAEELAAIASAFKSNALGR